MSEHWQTFQEVWKELSSLIVHAGHTSAQKLQFLLRNHKLKFLNLLKKNVRFLEQKNEIVSLSQNYAFPFVLFCLFVYTPNVILIAKILTLLLFNYELCFVFVLSI